MYKAEIRAFRSACLGQDRPVGVRKVRILQTHRSSPFVVVTLGNSAFPLCSGDVTGVQRSTLAGWTRRGGYTLEVSSFVQKTQVLTGAWVSRHASALGISQVRGPPLSPFLNV